VTRRAPDLQLRLLGPQHATLQADPMRLAQILTNLLDNACHAAGPCGTVCIEIVHDGAGWRTEVIDDGPGVAVEDRERIFDPLVRIDASRSRHTAGSGSGYRSPASWPELTAATLAAWTAGAIMGPGSG